MTQLTPNNLDVRVSDAVVEGGNVAYRVCLMHPLRSSVTVSYVMRRYSDLEPMMRRLKALPESSGQPLPPVPEKKFFGNTAPEFVESRRQGLELFLRAVAHNQDLCTEADYLQAIGYPPPPAALASAGVEMPGVAGIASSVGARAGGGAATSSATRAAAAAGTVGGGGKAGAGAAGVAPTTVAAIAQVTPWVRAPPAVNSEGDIAAAQGWVRGTQFRLVRPLPPLSYRRNSKTNFLIEDPSQPANSGARQLLLSVYTPDPQLTVSIPDERKLQVVTRTVMGSLGAAQPLYAEPIVFTADKGRMFVVRKIFPAGSLLDQMFRASEPLSEASRKYGSRPRAFSTADVATVGRQLLLLVKQAHEFNVPLPALHIGNIFLGIEGKSIASNIVVLSDVEAPLLGLGGTPTQLPVTGREDADSVTHIDILRIGVVLLSMGVGMPLRAEAEVNLLRTCGTPWMPSFTNPKLHQPDGDDDDETATNATSSRRHGGGGGAHGHHHSNEFQAPPASVYGDIQEPLLSILQYIFLPTNKADVDALLNHSFFRGAKLTKGLKQMLVDPATGAASENGVLPSLTGLKKKDVELFVEAAGKWTALLEQAEAAGRRVEDGKGVLRELRRIGKQKRREAMLNPEPEVDESSVPPTAGALAASQSMAAAPVRSSKRERRERAAGGGAAAHADPSADAEISSAVQQQAAPAAAAAAPAPQVAPAPAPKPGAPSGHADLMASIRGGGGGGGGAPAPAPTPKPGAPAGHGDLMAAIRGGGGGGGGAPAPTPKPGAPAGHGDLMAAIRGGGGAAASSTPAPAPAPKPGAPSGHAALMASIRGGGGGGDSGGGGGGAAPTPAPKPAAPSGHAALMAAIRGGK